MSNFRRQHVLASLHETRRFRGPRRHAAECLESGSNPTAALGAMWTSISNAVRTPACACGRRGQPKLTRAELLTSLRVAHFRTLASRSESLRLTRIIGHNDREQQLCCRRLCDPSTPPIFKGYGGVDDSYNVFICAAVCDPPCAVNVTLPEPPHPLFRFLLCQQNDRFVLAIGNAGDRPTGLASERVGERDAAIGQCEIDRLVRCASIAGNDRMAWGCNRWSGLNRRVGVWLTKIRAPPA